MIVVKITDGLGNQMFQYAYAKSLQFRTSQRIYLDISDINCLQGDKSSELVKLHDRRNYQLDNFLITLPVIDPERIKQMYKETNKKSKFRKYCDALYLSPNIYWNESGHSYSEIRYTWYQNYYIKGYFFDKKYYESYQDIFRQEFKLRKKICIPEEIEQILKNKKTVSLHIRRGDFLRINRNISENDYYNRALAYMHNKLGDVFLFIFSDDIEWVKNNKQFWMDHVFISDKNFSTCEELTLMSMCKHNIIANSTYSYWGAWLNCNKEKIVIAPRGWRQKIIPQSWVLL